ncbi:MAG TPA: glycosyltransferase [Cyclobacteriaceae bacterium]|nr:glycosyltransferase [Cyclobacteriaceae bacterium]
MSDPAISVVMPVFNSERYLVEAIESILNQTFTDFEFLIFDDGSADRSPKIIRKYAEKDTRIVAEFSPVNRGYVYYLNEGIRRSRGQYIARMDSDDVAVPMRFDVQKRFLDENPDIGIVGSATIEIDPEGKELGIHKRPTGRSSTEWHTFFLNPFAHPSVMYRRNVFDAVQLYNHESMPSEDYDLWCRMLGEWSFANIADPLIKRRTHGQSVTAVGRSRQWVTSTTAQVRLWKEHIGVDLSENELLFLRTFHKGYDGLSPSDAYPIFSKMVALRKWILNRYGKIDSVMRRDFFRRSLYLGLKARSHNFGDALRIFSYLLTHCPDLLVRFIMYRNV